MRRSEIWWAKIPEPVGTRPVLLLTRDQAYNVRNAVTAATITRTIRHIRSEVPIGKEDGMPDECVVNLDDIITIRKVTLLERITTLSPEKMNEVAKAISFALDLKIR